MSLTVHLNLPPDVEKQILADVGDINADVTKAYAIELFRRDRLSHYELSQILGLDRFETDAYLKRNNIFEGSLTMEDLEEQRLTLERVLGPVDRG